METAKSSSSLQQLGATLLNNMMGFIACVHTLEEIDEKLAAILADLTDLTDSLLKERNALLACRRHEQRCHDCPAYDCVDNTNPNKVIELKEKRK